MSGRRCIPAPSSIPKRSRTDATSIPKPSVCQKPSLRPSKIGIARGKDHGVHPPRAVAAIVQPRAVCPTRFENKLDTTFNGTVPTLPSKPTFKSKGAVISKTRKTPDMVYKTPTEARQQLTKLQNENEMYKEELRKAKENILKCNEKCAELQEQLENKRLEHLATIDVIGSKLRSTETENKECLKRIDSYTEKINSFHIHPVTLQPLLSPAEEEELKQKRQEARRKAEDFIVESERESQLDSDDDNNNVLLLLDTINVKPLYPADEAQ
ncbi:uncharacterized protein LOC100376097 [Saccoglossus kowalevskii]|uniref:Uncharacterized protein LOC100376097 isoform X1 n=1 Tax=Saccoglossus kowalevskii TaxID=10224 RepID=A0ABM0GK14_SACKO|nr:PREDICTED: uncharacterized protein LOC100376097 isoform X1 [Saccoglossus kowalevskii]